MLAHIFWRIANCNLNPSHCIIISFLFVIIVFVLTFVPLPYYFFFSACLLARVENILGCNLTVVVELPPLWWQYFRKRKIIIPQYSRISISYFMNCVRGHNNNNDKTNKIYISLDFVHFVRFARHS